MQSYISQRQLTLTFFLLLGLAWPTHVNLTSVLQYKHIQLNDTQWYINHDIVTSLFLSHVCLTIHNSCDNLLSQLGKIQWREPELYLWKALTQAIIVALGAVESPEARWSQLEHMIERINTVVIASIKWYLINRLLVLATVLDSMLAFSSLYLAWVIFTPEHMHHLFVHFSLTYPSLYTYLWLGLWKETM